MIEGEDGIEKIYGCPKCKEALLLTNVSPRGETGSYLKTLGYATEAFDLFQIDEHIKADSNETAAFDHRHGFKVVVIGCKKCGHLLAVIPHGAGDVEESISGLYKDIEAFYWEERKIAQERVKEFAKGILNGLRTWQCQEDEDRHSELLERDEKVVESFNIEDFAQRAVEAFVEAAESTIERQLTNAVDRLASVLSNSIATAVASAVDKKMGECEQRAISQRTEERHLDTPIPVRIVEIDPEAVIRIEDDGRERDVRITNTPLDVRQLPG